MRANLRTEFAGWFGLSDIAYRSSIAYRYAIISIWKNVFFRGSISM